MDDLKAFSTFASWDSNGIPNVKAMSDERRATSHGPSAMGIPHLREGLP
jgi:hypothetical protein